MDQQWLMINISKNPHMVHHLYGDDYTYFSCWSSISILFAVSYCNESLLSDLIHFSNFSANISTDLYNNTNYTYVDTRVTYVCNDGYIMTSISTQEVLTEEVITCEEKTKRDTIEITHVGWSVPRAYCKRELFITGWHKSLNFCIADIWEAVTYKIRNVKIFFYFLTWYLNESRTPTPPTRGRGTTNTLLGHP